MSPDTSVPAPTLPSGDRCDQGGFTLIEILVALIVLIIGVAGILTMQMSALKGTSYSRHATEAIVLAEDKLEELIAMDPNSGQFVDGNDTVNAQSQPAGGADFPYNRTWTVAGSPIATVTLQIQWQERNRDTYTLTFVTQRTRN